MTFLLGDVPDSAGVVEAHQSVGGADLVKSGALLVAKDHLRNPDVIPRVVFEFHRRAVAVGGRVELESHVVPADSQVHAQRVVLQYIQTRALRSVHIAPAS